MLSSSPRQGIFPNLRMKVKRRCATASHSLSLRSEAERGEGGVRGRPDALLLRQRNSARRATDERARVRTRRPPAHSAGIPRPRRSGAAPRGPDIPLLLVEQRDELVDHFVADVHGARRKGKGRGGLSAGAHFQRDRSGPAVLFRRKLGHVLQDTDFTQRAGDAIQRSARLAVDHLDLRLGLAGSAHVRPHHALPRACRDMVVPPQLAGDPPAAGARRPAP